MTDTKWLGFVLTNGVMLHKVVGDHETIV